MHLIYIDLLINLKIYKNAKKKFYTASKKYKSKISIR